MKFSKFPGMTVVAFASGALFLVSCSDPQKQAGKTLGTKGYELSPKDLLLAAAAGDLESIDLFVAAGIDIDSPDKSGNTALIRAAGAGQMEAVEKILGLGADPRQINSVGRDALISASAKGYEDVARMLLNRGADTTIKDSEGWGALSISAYNGHAGVVSLLSSSATAAELDDALLVSSFTGDAKVISTLLGQGANINSRSPESKTPLMIASEAGKMDAVRVLLQNQANPYAVDLNNATAASLAKGAGFEEVSQLIASPDTWGTNTEGRKIAGEMAEAQKALTGSGIEETLSGEPTAPLLAGGLAPAASGGGARNEPIVGATGVMAKGKGASSSGGSVSAGSQNTTRRGAGSENALVAKTGTANTDRGKEVPANKVASGTKGVDRKIAVSVGSASSNSPAPAKPSVQSSRQIREEAQSKPIVALNGSTLHSRSPMEAPVKSMVLAAYHEESLPIMVDNVSGSTASVRRLDQGTAQSYEVVEGAVIPGTSYKVQEVTTRFVSSKEGKGSLVDVSRVKVEDTRSGATHLLVKDVSGQSSDTYAILATPNSQYRYVVKAGDVFQTSQPDTGMKEYQVLDIRPTGVVIKDLATDEVVTVARDGVITP